EAAVTVVSGGVPPYTYLWSPGGETTDTIKRQCEGDYCCTITGANGCSENVCVVVTNTSGIDNIQSATGLSIYPNPNNGIFTISNSNYGLGIMNLEVYNVLGQNLLSQPLSNTQENNIINLSNKAAGMYFYRVVKEDGGLLGSGKILIQK
ncbi:MAG TPA: T9SS type A sorting domain-containing protein, partial [Bacteroidia bacterium]|nr:T9SS type A sorting domain-containing protein [Bacteroidia bacterium]